MIVRDQELEELEQDMNERTNSPGGGKDNSSVDASILYRGYGYPSGWEGKANTSQLSVKTSTVLGHPEYLIDEQELNECIGATEATINGVNLNDIDGIETVKYNKYLHEIKPGVFVDVYDVLMAWNVTNPALQHLIKKALQAGERGHKSREQDLQDIIDGAIRAKELEIK